MRMVPGASSQKQALAAATVGELYYIITINYYYYLYYLY
jgi:hypothetical protein